MPSIITGVISKINPIAIAHCPTTVSSSIRQIQMPRKKPTARWMIVIPSITAIPTASESAAKLSVFDASGFVTINELESNENGSIKLGLALAGARSN